MSELPDDVIEILNYDEPTTPFQMITTLWEKSGDQTKHSQPILKLPSPKRSINFGKPGTPDRTIQYSSLPKSISVLYNKVD